MTEIYIGIGIGITIMLVITSIVAIRLRKVFDPKRLIKILNQTHIANLGVQGKLDKGFTRAIIQDLTQKDNPIGFALSLFPNGTEYLNQNPTSIVGAIELFKAIMEVPNFLAMMSNVGSLSKKGLNKGNNTEIVGAYG